jgi:hypothetical protein
LQGVHRVALRGLRGPLRPTPGLSGEGTGGYGEMGALDPSLQDPKHYQMEYLRRRIRQQLYAVQLGLLGTDDHAEKKAGAAAAKTPPPAPPPPAGGPVEKKEPRGMYAIAKAGQEKEQVDEVYFKVRKLAEVVEAAGVLTEPQAQFHQFVKDMRKEMTKLELAVGKRLPPPGAAPGGNVPPDDAPAVGGIGGKAGPGKGPAAPKGAAPAPAKRPPGAPGKAASRPPARPQPTVFGQPRFGR